VEYPQAKLPADAEFKEYQEVIVQDISLKTDNVLFRKEKYYSPTSRQIIRVFRRYSISAGYLSNLLIKNHVEFETEKSEVYESGLESSSWQHLDQTGARVGGVNYTTNVVYNPLYTIYLTTAKKDRLSVVKALQNGQELALILNRLTDNLLDNFLIPTKWKTALKLLPQETVFSEAEFNTLLDTHLPKLGSQQRTRIIESAAIAFYHQQTD